MTWRRRKRGSRRQRGKPFLSSEDPKIAARQNAIRAGSEGARSDSSEQLLSLGVTGDPRRDLAKEQYLQGLLRESKTYDIAGVLSRFNSEGRASQKVFIEAEKDVQAATQEAQRERARMQVIRDIMTVLQHAQKSGRTRVGDSELRYLARSTLQKYGLPLDTPLP